MQVAWNALMNAPNPGAAFAQSFQQGMDRNRERALIERRMALQERQLSQEQEDEWRKYAGTLAKWADTPEKWDQAVDYLVQSGHPDAAQLKGKFSPALRAHFMAQGGVADENVPQDPSMIREFDIARERGLIPPNTAYEDFLRMRNPGMQSPVILPNNVAPVGGGMPQPGTIVDDPRKGGTAGNGGGNFLGPL